MYIIIQYIIYIILFQLSALYLYEKKISYNIQKSLLNYWNLHIVEVGKKKERNKLKIDRVWPQSMKTLKGSIMTMLSAGAFAVLWKT